MEDGLKVGRGVLVGYAGVRMEEIIFSCILCKVQLPLLLLIAPRYRIAVCNFSSGYINDA